MARPRRSEHTKERIIEQGIDLLSEHGYHGTGLKQILDAVKVPKGSFYNYFESKENFAAEIIESYTESLIQQFDGYIQTTSDDPATAIRTVYQLMIDSFEQQGCEKGCLIGNMAAEIGGSSDVCQQAMQSTVNKWHKRFVALVEKGQTEKLFRKDLSSEEIADLFWNLWEGGILRMKIEGNANRLRRSVDLMINTLLRA